MKNGSYNNSYYYKTIYTCPSKVTGVDSINLYESYVTYATPYTLVAWNGVTQTGQNGIYSWEYEVYNNKGGKVKYSTYCSNNYFKNYDGASVYKVRVRAYVYVNGSKVYGPYSDWYEYMPEVVTTGGTAKNKILNGKLKVTWKKVSGAKYYDIYVASKGNGTNYKTYKKVKTVRGNKGTVTLTKDNKGKAFKYNKYYYVAIVARSGKLTSNPPKKGYVFGVTGLRTRTYWY